MASLQIFILVFLIAVVNCNPGYDPVFGYAGTGYGHGHPKYFTEYGISDPIAREKKFMSQYIDGNGGETKYMYATAYAASDSDSEDDRIKKVLLG